MLYIEEYLSKILNGFLALDDESKQGLHSLQNKIITIELIVSNTPFFKQGKNAFQLFFTESSIQVKIDNLFPQPDVIIKGTPLALSHMALARQNRKQFFTENVSIAGDLELGQQIIALFDRLEIDWEEYLSHWLGDVSAYQLVRFSKKMRAFSQRLRTTLAQNINEYVHEEVNLFPAAEALQDFNHEVDTLRMDADRLAARVQQLTVKIANKRGQK